MSRKTITDTERKGLLRATDHVLEHYVGILIQ
jgi:hypothetical protein